MNFTPTERHILLITGIGHFATHFFELMFPTLAVALAAETGIPLQEIIGWSFAGYLLFGFGSLPAGFLADRVGARRLLLVGLGGMGLSAMIAGQSAPGTSLALSLAVLGVFASMYHPAGMSLISRGIVARGRALGINGICGNLGIAMTPLLTAVLVAHLGWRQAFTVAGLSACILAIVAWSIPVKDVFAPPSQTFFGPEGSSPRNRRWIFPLLCVATMLAGISYRGNTLVQPAYFAERVGFMGYGTTTSLVYLTGILGQYWGGLLADRYDLRWLYLLFHGVSLPAILLMAYTSQLDLILVAGTFVFFSLGMQPIENSLFARFTPDRWRATGYGMKFVLTFGVGSVAVRLVQWIKVGQDLSLVFCYLAGFVALLLVAILMIIVLTAGERIHNIQETVAFSS